MLGINVGSSFVASGLESALNDADADGDGRLDYDELIRRRRGANHAYGKTSQVKF